MAPPPTTPQCAWQLFRREPLGDAVHHRGGAGAVAERFQFGDEVVGTLTGDYRSLGRG